jgi:N-glycosylase/DNA lyase
VLARNGLILKPKSKSLSRKRYLEIEKTLADLAAKAKVSLAELDLYLWYMETGKILK